MLEKEGVESSAEMALIGNEKEVETMLKDYSYAGATDIAVQIFPTGQEADSSLKRSMAFLSGLVGKI